MLETKARNLAMTSSREEEEQIVKNLVTEPKQIALRSKVVAATAYPEGIVVVKMEDREAKNMFSDQLLEGVTEAFRHIEQQSAGYKVVVLTGYDSYFSCGGTKENLLAIQGGKARFTDHKIFQLPLDCKLPVIAAMQGHGIGAGWTLGLFADVVMLSEESRYVSPYMNYGFTPGAGATWILGEKLGEDLARESLLTGEQCSGKELKTRGVKLRVLPRAEVQRAAMKLARQIAQNPRDGLIDFKQRLKGNVGAQLEETYRLELAMHEKTFVGQSETLAQIESKFYDETETFPASSQQGAVEPAKPPSKSDLLSVVTATLKMLLADELHMQESDIDEDVEFIDLGLDSIGGVTWLRKINERYHTSIEATKVYSYPTLAQLSRYVKEEAERQGTLPSQSVAVAETRNSSSRPGIPTMRPELSGKKLTSCRRRKAIRFSGAPASQASHSEQAIAVIGMSGRYPQANNLDEFWNNIVQGRNCITQVPSDRWDANRYYDPNPSGQDKISTKWLGVLDNIDCFDPLFFNISPQEAEYIDPQHRLFLLESYRAFEDAGYSSQALSNKNCGVYLGISTDEYALLLSQKGVLSTPVTSNSHAIAAARIAYYLNLKGPAISIDTACSSSLVAIHLACQGLLSGETDMALAGGVSVWLTPGSYFSMGQAGMLSPSGQCKAFDDTADGIVLGEGVGALVLKRLKDAQEDNDFIYGIILGSGINQDGRTNGITAPNALSQIELERSVYARHNIDPETISYVETHGTGTRLGDPIELEALGTVFKEKTNRKNYCALGSVKSNIGHTAAAAGIASVQKVLLSLQHRILAPTLNVTKENSHFDFKNSPFYICKTQQAWDAAPGSLRRAAVSSFGYSGTNAHLVIEESSSPVRSAVPSRGNASFIVPVSARTEEQLRQKVRDLLEFIRPARQGRELSQVSSRPVDLAAVAYTLQIGRDAIEERLGFVVNSLDKLSEKLGAYINGEKNIEDCYQGHVEPGDKALKIIGCDTDMQEVINKWIAHNNFSKLLDLWVRGLNFDWNILYGDVKPQRISLPTYPFAQERYWIPETALHRNGDAPFEEDVDIASIEDIINKLDDDMIETDQAVKQLKMLV
jgi:3-oxoacyl-(acyl-carrier-protein) synthase/enoyl-CoA hydratase/carnithine racemase/acyl carrier protein